MTPHETPVTHTAADRYEASRTLARKYVKESVLADIAWQWGVWFLYNGDQCGTRCPYWPDTCFVGSDTCLECPGCEGIQIVTAHSGRVFCKNKRAEVKPLPECYFLPEGRERTVVTEARQLPEELCPW